MKVGRWIVPIAVWLLLGLTCVPASAQIVSQGPGGSSPWLVRFDGTGTNNVVDLEDNAARLLGTITFDGPQPVTGTFWQATQPVSIATMPSTPVTGTFWQATQPISGTVAVSNVTAWGGVTFTGAAALDDATANPTVPPIGAFNMLWNGFNWERAQSVIGQGALTYLSNSASLGLADMLVGSASLSSTTCPGTGCVSVNDGINQTGSMGTILVTQRGTYSGVNMIFEISSDGTNYFPTACSRSDDSVLATTTTGLQTDASLAWRCAMGGGANNFRVRVTAITSGSVSVRINGSQQSTTPQAVTARITDGTDTAQVEIDDNSVANGQTALTTIPLTYYYNTNWSEWQRWDRRVGPLYFQDASSGGSFSTATVLNSTNELNGGLPSTDLQRPVAVTWYVNAPASITGGTISFETSHNCSSYVTAWFYDKAAFRWVPSITFEGLLVAKQFDVALGSNRCVRVKLTQVLTGSGSVSFSWPFTNTPNAATNVGGAVAITDGTNKVAVTPGAGVAIGGALHSSLRNNSGTEIASATSSPAGTELGLVVRNVPSGTQGVNVSQMNGVTVSMGVGSSDTGTQRVASLIHDGTDTAQVTTTGGGSLQVECTSGCGSAATGQTYIANVVSAASAASKDYLNLFNAVGSGKVLKVLSIGLIADNTAAISGIGFTFRINKTSSVGATCTAQTIQKVDSTNANVPSQVTASTNCTTDPSISFVLGACHSNADEAAVINQGIGVDGNCYEFSNNGGQPITLREGEGLNLVHNAVAPVGLATIVIVFTM